jgi:hypothetical protein
VGLERCPLSLVSTTEELLGRKSSGSGLENRRSGRRDPSRWPYGPLYRQNLALTSPTSGCRSVGTVRCRTQAMEFSFSLVLVDYLLSFMKTKAMFSSEKQHNFYQNIRRCIPENILFQPFWFCFPWEGKRIFSIFWSLGFGRIGSWLLWQAYRFHNHFTSIYVHRFVRKTLCINGCKFAESSESLADYKEKPREWS